jgi:putative phosphoesterase
MKTFAAVSDIHGNLPALEAVVADIARKDVDTVVNLGDHISGPLWPKETIQFLMRQNWVQISGNHDRQLIAEDPRVHGLSDKNAFQFLDDREKEWLRQLPSNARPDDDVLLFHGTPSSDTAYLMESIEHGRTSLASRSEIRKRLGSTRSPVMLCGHTHVQRIVEVDEDAVVINPGSVGLPAYKDEVPEPHVIESGSPHARYAILRYDTKWTVELISVPYDSSHAAAQARKNNRPDWATALLTGYTT